MFIHILMFYTQNKREVLNFRFQLYRFIFYWPEFVASHFEHLNEHIYNTFIAPKVPTEAN